MARKLRLDFPVSFLRPIICDGSIDDGGAEFIDFTSSRQIMVAESFPVKN